MKSYELKPTPENLLNTFWEDTISRNNDIFRFIDILNSVEDCCSIALDGNWGCGKTFFIKQTKMIMDAHNKCVTNGDESIQRKIIQKHSEYRSLEKLKMQPQICVYYDAWENDNDDDPILSLVYCIMQSIDMDYSLKENPNCLQVGVSILEFISGKNFGQIIEKLQGEDPLSVLKKEKDIHREISKFLDGVMCERGNRLVIFIDELDRCKPEYAVKLLERVKHYFDNDHISFVFSTNIKQLQHTIRRYYGDKFDAYKYLNRFFDLCIPMPKADYQKFYISMNFSDSYYTYDIVCDAVINAYHFELREVAKFLRWAKAAAYKPTHSNEYDLMFVRNSGIKFCLSYLIPVIIGIRVYDADIYEEFVHGRNDKPLLEVFGGVGDDLFYELLNNDETYGTPSENRKQVSLEAKIKELYNVIFVKQYTGAEYYTCIGKCQFTKDTKEVLFQVAGLRSKYTYLEVDYEQRTNF